MLFRSPVGSFILEIEGFAIDELYEKYGSSMGYYESEETGPNIFIKDRKSVV